MAKELREEDIIYLWGPELGKNDLYLHKPFLTVAHLDSQIAYTRLEIDSLQLVDSFSPSTTFAHVFFGCPDQNHGCVPRAPVSRWEFMWSFLGGAFEWILGSKTRPLRTRCCLGICNYAGRFSLRSTNLLPPTRKPAAARKRDRSVA